MTAIDPTLEREILTTPWLATRLGTQSARVHALRRAGQLLGVRRPGTQEYVYPAWQFDRAGKPLESLPRLVAAARSAGLDELALHRLVHRRAGLTSDRRLVDDLRDGRDEHVLAAIASARLP
jgi:hypothetical protein